MVKMSRQASVSTVCTGSSFSAPRGAVKGAARFIPQPWARRGLIAPPPHVDPLMHPTLLDNTSRHALWQAA